MVQVTAPAGGSTDEGPGTGGGGGEAKETLVREPAARAARKMPMSEIVNPPPPPTRQADIPSEVAGRRAAWLLVAGTAAGLLLGGLTVAWWFRDTGDSEAAAANKDIPAVVKQRDPGSENTEDRSRGNKSQGNRGSTERTADGHAGTGETHQKTEGAPDAEQAVDRTADIRDGPSAPPTDGHSADEQRTDDEQQVAEVNELPNVDSAPDSAVRPPGSGDSVPQNTPGGDGERRPVV